MIIGIGIKIITADSRRDQIRKVAESQFVYMYMYRCVIFKLFVNVKSVIYDASHELHSNTSKRQRVRPPLRQ